MTAVTRTADAILQALIIINSSINMSLTSPHPLCTIYTSSPRTLSPISTLKTQTVLLHWSYVHYNYIYKYKMAAISNYRNNVIEKLPRTVYLVSLFENFLSLTSDNLIPRRATIFSANSGLLFPAKTLMFGIIASSWPWEEESTCCIRRNDTPIADI